MDNAEELASEEEGWTKMGQHLRKLRTEGGWLQGTLGDAADVSEATIRSIENHKPGKQHTPRTLEKISRALGKPDNYLNDYRRNPPAEEPGDKPEVMRTAPPPRSALDLVVPRLDEIVVARLNEIVVPRLADMEKQVHALVDVMFKTSGVEVDIKHPGDPE
jgi:transcriptional regulator with XRE-family HTH domain